jgi:hypothetical protein
MLEGAEHIAVIGYGDSRHVVLLCFFYHGFNVRRTVQQRVLSMTMERSKIAHKIELKACGIVYKNTLVSLNRSGWPAYFFNMQCSLSRRADAFFNFPVKKKKEHAPGDIHENIFFGIERQMAERLMLIYILKKFIYKSRNIERYKDNRKLQSSYPQMGFKNRVIDGCFHADDNAQRHMLEAVYGDIQRRIYQDGR